MLNAYGLPAEATVLADLEARELEWLDLATTAAHADGDSFDRSPAHWADTAAWVAGELEWLRTHADQLADAIQTPRHQ